jgi:nicotinamide-nucleotide amidase
VGNRKTAVLLSQGDEVLTGQTLDTNASWLSERLTDLGFEMLGKLTVGDRVQDIAWAIRHACSIADVVVCSGGLGPTQDDLTSEAAASVLGVELQLFPAELAHIQDLYRRFGRPMAASNEKQAWLPETTEALRNDWGTAPGFRMQHQGALAYFVPGVPREMRSFWRHHIRPDLVERFDLHPERLVVLRCMGIHESRLATLLQPFSQLPDATLGFRTKLPENQVKLRLSPSMPPKREAELVEQVRSAIGSSVFGVNCGELEDVIGQLLVAEGSTVATAESCTGGRVSARLTSVAGSSRYFLEGACVYANAAKVRTCGVDPKVLAHHGAVSEPVARQMAEGIRQRTGATYGLATTGIAGPGGGTPDKPVGTVHIALATPNVTHHLRLKLVGDRDRITALSAGAVLDMLRRQLQGILSPS